MKTEQNQLGQTIGTPNRRLSPIAQAVMKQSAQHFNTDYGHTNVDELGVGGPSFHNPCTPKGMENGRM